MTWEECRDALSKYPRRVVVLAAVEHAWESLIRRRAQTQRSRDATWALDVARRWVVGEADEDEVRSAYRATNTTDSGVLPVVIAAMDVAHNAAIGNRTAYLVAAVSAADVAPGVTAADPEWQVAVADSSLEARLAALAAYVEQAFTDSRRALVARCGHVVESPDEAGIECRVEGLPRVVVCGRYVWRPASDIGCRDGRWLVLGMDALSGPEQVAVDWCLERRLCA